MIYLHFICDVSFFILQDCTSEITCYNCSKVGHTSKDCPKNSNPEADMVCYSCNETGHSKRNCPYDSGKILHGKNCNFLESYSATELLSSLNQKHLTFQESLNGMLSLIWNVIIVKKKAIYPEIALKTVASRVIIVGLMGTYLEIARKGT